MNQEHEQDADFGEPDLVVIDQKIRKRLARVAWLMDNSIPLPGGFRVGLDGIIGLIPGIGDATGAIISTYIMSHAIRAGVPRRILLQMTGNIAIELCLGAIPLLGDIFDFVFKANQKNVELIEHYLQAPGPTKRRSTLWLVAFVVILMSAIVAIGWVTLKILAALWSLIS